MDKSIFGLEISIDYGVCLAHFLARNPVSLRLQVSVTLSGLLHHLIHLQRQQSLFTSVVKYPAIVYGRIQII